MGLLIKKNLLPFITGLIFLNVGISDPFKDLDINFLLEDSTKPKSTKKVKNKNPSKEKAFNDVIKGFQKIDGLFTIYWDNDKNKAYFAILPEQLEKIYISINKLNSFTNPFEHKRIFI